MYRKDAWTIEEDQLLMKTIINKVKEGGTQLEGIKQGSKLLSRTEAACGYRFNAILRKEYADDLKAAKEGDKKEFIIEGKHRFSKKKAPSVTNNETGIDGKITEGTTTSPEGSKNMFSVLEDVKATLEFYMKENAQLKEQLQEMNEKPNKEDLLYEFAKIVADIIAQDDKAGK